jgi:undecaprenol kinase
MSLIVHYLKALEHSLRGLKQAISTDRSFRFQVFLLGPLVAIIGYLLWPLTQVELFFLLLGWMLVIITEMQNTSIETALDHLHPNLHKEIGHSKDMAAASVLLAGVFLAIVIVVIALY